MAEEAEVPASSPRGLVGTAASRTSAGESDPNGEAGLYLDEPTSASPGRRAPRKLVLTAAAAIVLVAVGTSLALVASGGNTHGSQSGGTSGVPGSTDREQVVSALSATTSAGNWDVSYTYGEVSGSASTPTPTTASGSASTPTPTTTSCPASQNAVCIVTPGGGSVQDVTVTGTGIIDVNPKAMVADADVSDFGHVVLRVDSSQVWEILSGDSGGLAPDPGEEQTMGQSLPGYAGLVEGTLGTREGAVAMLGIASPTGYLELDEQAILGVTPAGTGTVDGQAVTQYKVSVQPSELASDPTASPQQVSAIRAALAALDGVGMSATTDQVAVDAQGYIVQSISTYQFSDGGSVRVQADFSNFGCAGTVLMPGQTGSTAPSACASPDTGGNVATSSTSTTTAPTTTTSSPQDAVVPGPVGTVPTTTPAPSGATTTPSLRAGASTIVAVPNVLGDSPAAATTALAASGLDVLFAGGQNGAVVSQSPAANSRVPEHSTVVLTTQ
jgi:hypothetical protein